MLRYIHKYLWSHNASKAFYKEDYRYAVKSILHLEDKLLITNTYACLY